MAKAGPAKADKVLDALATAAAALGFGEDEIVVSDDADDIVLFLARGERTCSVRIPREGLPRAARPLAGLAERAASGLAIMVDPRGQAAGDPPEPLPGAEPLG